MPIEVARATRRDLAARLGLRPPLPDDPALAAERRKIYVDEARLEVGNSSVGFVVAVAAFA